MAKVTKTCVGKSLVGDGNEVAHVDLLIGPRGSAVETAFCNSLTNNKDGFTTLLALIAPNLATNPIPCCSTRSRSKAPSRRSRCSVLPSMPSRRP